MLSTLDATVNRMQPSDVYIRIKIMLIATLRLRVTPADCRVFP